MHAPAASWGGFPCQLPPQQALGATHSQRWSWNHSWNPGAVWLRKQGWNLSTWLHEPWIYLHLCIWLCKFGTYGTSKWTKDPPCSLDTSDFSNYGLCGCMPMGTSPGQGLSCLHSFQSGSRFINTAALGPDFSGFALVALWKQALRGTRANCQHSHDWDGAEHCANRNVLCEFEKWMKGNPTEHTHWWNLWWRNIHLLLTQWECLPSHLLCTTAQKCSLQIWGLMLQQLGSRPCSWDDSDNHRAQRKTHSTFRARSSHHITKGITTSLQ